MKDELVKEENIKSIQEDKATCEKVRESRAYFKRKQFNTVSLVHSFDDRKMFD